MDVNTIVYRVVEITFFVVFVVCMRDAWRRGKYGDPDIEPENQWKTPNHLWIFIMLAAMAFTFTFEYALTHRRFTNEEAFTQALAKCESDSERSSGECELIFGKPEDFPKKGKWGNPGSNSIYSYKVKALLDLGEIELDDGTIKEGSAVPLWIPAGWALIIYLVMRTSDKLALNWYKRPVMDALMALVIDFALDPVASLNEWWLWDTSELEDMGSTFFFGIPATNFMAWIVIVGAFSFFIRLFQRWREGETTKGVQGVLSWPFRKLPKGILGDFLVPMIATIPSVWIVINYTNFARMLMGQKAWYTDGALLCSIVWAACLIWCFRDAPIVRRDHAHDHVLMFSPLAIYGVVLLALYTTRTPGSTQPLYDAMPELVLFVPLSAILGAIVFAWPYSKPGLESWW
jgi:hypothetical protein